jgi:hypothetical protein
MPSGKELPPIPSQSSSSGTSSSLKPNGNPSPAQNTTDLFPAYMNGNSDPNTTAKMSKGSPSYPDVNGRERTEFMTFHPKQGSSDRLDFCGRPLVEAVYESIKGSRSASRLGHYELDVDDERKSDGEPPELPATSFPRGHTISGPTYPPPIPMSLRNGEQQKEPWNFVEVDTLNYIETED